MAGRQDNVTASVPGHAERLRDLVLPLVRSGPLLIASVAVWLSAFAWLRPLTSPDETRYTDIPRWMVASGDWLVPRINGLPFVHKPPLFFWLEAIAIELFGLGTFTSRIPALVAGVLICGCVYALVRRFRDAHAAAWSVAALALNPLLYGGSQYANLDMLVASLITLTITIAVFAVHEVELTRERRLWIAAYASAGLSFLAKGLIGIALPGAVFVIYCLAAGQYRWLLRAISLPGLAVLALIALPWMILVERAAPGFTYQFIVVQHFARYTAGGFNNQFGPWFYPAVLAVAMLPWTITTLPMWGKLWRERARAPSLELLGIVWFLTILVFFSIPRSKIAGYIFPCLPAFAMLAGPWLAAHAQRRLAASIAAIVCLVAVVIAAVLAPRGATPAAASVRALIKPEDTMVFHGRYFFDASVVFDRSRPAYLVGDWSKTASELPDNVPRQLTEGREVDPPSGRVLISDAAFLELAAKPGTVWVVTRGEPKQPLPAHFAGFAIAAESGDNLILRRTNPGTTP